MYLSGKVNFFLPMIRYTTAAGLSALLLGVGSGLFVWHVLQSTIPVEDQVGQFRATSQTAAAAYPDLQAKLDRAEDHLFDLRRKVGGDSPFSAKAFGSSTAESNTLGEVPPARRTRPLSRDESEEDIPESGRDRISDWISLRQVR